MYVKCAINIYNHQSSSFPLLCREFLYVLALYNEEHSAAKEMDNYLKNRTESVNQIHHVTNNKIVAPCVLHGAQMVYKHICH